MAYEHGKHASRAMSDLVKKQYGSKTKDSSPRGFMSKKKKKKPIKTK